MTKEQEVIKYIETRIKICNENADICDDNNFDEEATYLRKESYMLETVLSMLKEKDEQIAKYEKIYKEYDCYRWVKELDKKDKIIDLMAKAMDKIQDPQVCKYCDNKINLSHGYCVDAGKCKEGIKRYFERKSEE